MNTPVSFNGFSPQTTDFLHNLRENNSKEWFQKHKDDFEKYIMQPAREFVTSLGERLAEVAPGIQAIPQVDKSIFRIYRDVRFSKDKSPYKFHLGIFLWEGGGPKMECSGFYFELRPEEFFLGTGMYQFTKPQLQEWRRSVSDDTLGMDLIKIIQSIPQKEMHEFGGEHYKRVPQGYDPEHFNADLLKYNGFYVHMKHLVTDFIYTDEFIDFCAKKYIEMAPLHGWLKEMTARA